MIIHCALTFAVVGHMLEHMCHPQAHELLYGWGCEGIESVLVLLVASLCVPVVRGISELFAKLLGVGI